MGAGGPRPTPARKKTRRASHAGRSNDQSCYGEKLWHREAGIDRANGATRHRKPTPNEDAARRRKRRVEARLG
jgi:hypothetical protein